MNKVIIGSLFLVEAAVLAATGQVWFATVVAAFGGFVIGAAGWRKL